MSILMSTVINGAIVYVVCAYLFNLTHQTSLLIGIGCGALALMCQLAYHSRRRLRVRQS